MGRYTIRDKTGTSSAAVDLGYDSCYESDAGTKYTPVKDLGTGTFAKARLFRSSTGKKVAVLTSVKKPADFGEADCKYEFFKRNYPDKQSHIFANRTEYRLVLPYIEHTAFEHLTTDDPEQQKTLFKSAINALIACHEKGIICLDLKKDNVYFDPSHNKSYLIDGGHSCLIGTVIDPLAFQKSSADEVALCKQRCKHIAPECWSVRPLGVVANPKMDIYSLGKLMKSIIGLREPQLFALVMRCLETDPDSRPTLPELLTALDGIIFSVELVTPDLGSMGFCCCL